MAKAAKLSREERTERSAAIHSLLDDAAAVINGFHAKVLTGVIEATDWNIHRDVDGFSAVREWLVRTFDFHARIAADLATIARLSRKFTRLTAAATSGDARIDPVAYAVRQLEKSTPLRLYARTPYREPVPSPWDETVTCTTPEALLAQYCIHASYTDLRTHLEELEAALADQDELFDGLSEESMQRLELWEQDNGMWHLEADLSATTGELFAKFLNTAVPPPRQDEVDADGVLPPQANRNAEALHHMLTVYGTDPHAATRHGHTATLNLTVDIETLQGKDTGRVPMLEGRPISLAKARLLACEGVVIPSVFNYATGEAVELGRTKRLPTPALRRKLELEQPGGCAWEGCGRPVAWCEAHHIEHWANGGPTIAANLVLLCRFHHGRIHTPGWTIEKTGPGQALIVHHEGHDGHEAADDLHGCGCADYRTDADLDAAFEDDVANAFPTGLYPEEWGEALTDDLAAVAQEHELDALTKQAKAARAKARARFTTPAPAEDTPGPVATKAPAPAATPAPVATDAPNPVADTDRHADQHTEASTPDGPDGPSTADTPVEESACQARAREPIPFLGRPRHGPCRGGSAPHTVHSPNPSRGSGPSACPHPESPATSPPEAPALAPTPTPKQPRGGRCRPAPTESTLPARRAPPRPLRARTRIPATHTGSCRRSA